MQDNDIASHEPLKESPPGRNWEDIVGEFIKIQIDALENSGLEKGEHHDGGDYYYLNIDGEEIGLAWVGIRNQVVFRGDIIDLQKDIPGHRIKGRFLVEEIYGDYTHFSRVDGLDNSRDSILSISDITGNISNTLRANRHLRRK